ncbi:MAG: hypothetical protein C3F15_15755 [Holophagae bacterium]|nr:MAG: hypothetical protein C3F15_15755 [Holophagae bacterium]
MLPDPRRFTVVREMRWQSLDGVPDQQFIERVTIDLGRLVENTKHACERYQVVRRFEDQASCTGQGLRFLDSLGGIAAEALAGPATLPAPVPIRPPACPLEASHLLCGTLMLPHCEIVTRDTVSVERLLALAAAAGRSAAIVPPEVTA